MTEVNDPCEEDFEIELETTGVVSPPAVSTKPKSAPKTQIDPLGETPFYTGLTSEDVVKLLQRKALEPVTIPFVRGPGETRARHRKVTGEPAVFSSFIEALWDTEGSVPQFEPPQKLHELQLWDSEKSRLLRFHGTLMFDRLCAFATTVCGEDREKVLLHELGDEHFVIRGTLKTWARSAAGGSSIKDQKIWNARGRDEGFRLLKAKDFTLRTQVFRFWKGVFDMHLFLSLIGQTKDTVFHVAKVHLIEAALAAGKFGNPFTDHLKEGINQLMNLDSNHEVTHYLRGLPVDLQAQFYKLRKVIPKDDNDEAENCRRAMDRFCSEETWDQLPEADEGVRLFQEEFRNFVESATEEQRQIWRDPPILHQGSAGLWFTRGQGGRASELHLIVGLYRLSQKTPSTLSEVFGVLTESDDVETWFKTLGDIDSKRQEIIEACEWFHDEFVMARKIPMLFFCIFPEREVKSRTFLLFDYASQLGGNLAKNALVSFLKTRKFCEEAYRGIRATSNAHELIRRATDEGLYVLSADASTSTDNLDHSRCLSVFEPIMGLIPRFAGKIVRDVFSPFTVGFTTTRPTTDVLSGLALEREVFDELNALVEDEQPLSRKTHRPSKLTFEVNVPNVRLKQYYSEIRRALDQHDRVLLKAPTGSGKTVLAAAMTRSIIQFTSIINLEAFSKSLDYYGVPHHIHYSTRKKSSDGTSHDGTRTILTTDFYVEQLSRKYPDMLVVLDEAETLRGGFMLNIIRSKYFNSKVLLMSATPDQIRFHDAYVIEFEASSPYRVEELTMDEEEMIKTLPGRKSLICVHSEPYARTLARRIPGAFVLDSNSRFGDYISEAMKADCIISTNVVRASLTIPSLEYVFDYGIQYESIDYPAQGVETLTVTEVDVYQRTQLKGRVGRMRDGVYVTVRHDISYVPQPKVPSLRLSEIASRDEIDLSQLPRKVSIPALLLERFHLRLLEKTFDVKLTNHLPPSVQLVKSQLNKGRRHLARALLFEESGIASRMTSLTISEVESDRELAAQFKTIVKSGNYLRQLEGFIRLAREKPMFRQQLELMDKWTDTLRDDDPDTHVLGSNAAAVLAGVICWRNVVRTVNSQYVSVFRDFTCSRRSGDPEYAILLGMSKFQGKSQYLVAVPIPAEEFEIVTSAVRAEVTIIARHSRDFDPDELEILRIEQHTSERTGRQTKAVSLRTTPRNQVRKPDELPYLLGLLEKQITKQAKDVRTTTRGCPQSHVLSFPVLNALNYCAYLGTRSRYRDFVALGYGDDALAAHGNKKALELFMACRESYGLRTNVPATGISQAGEGGLAVFCEMIFDLKTGREVVSPKPKPTNYAFRAYHREETCTPSLAYREDIQGVVSTIRNQFPSLHQRILAESDDAEPTVAMRITYPRRLLGSMIRRSVKPGSDVCMGPRAEAIFNYLESLVLLICPSTRGAPIRVPPRDNLPLMIPVSFYNDCESFLASHVNYAESDLRTLPPFSIECSAYMAVMRSTGRAMDVEEVRRALGDAS